MPKPKKRVGPLTPRPVLALRLESLLRTCSSRLGNLLRCVDAQSVVINWILLQLLSRTYHRSAVPKGTVKLVEAFLNDS